MKVLRIEHPESGMGYYQHGYDGHFNGDENRLSDYRVMKNRHDCNMDRWPNVYNDKGFDGNVQRSDKDFFGFANAEQACAWFTDGEFVMLFELGFELIEVEAKNIRYGERQVIFEKVRKNEM